MSKPEEADTAIALRYNAAERESAPYVVAKGQGFTAAEIIRCARENDIPLRQDAALAGALATLDIGTSIPPELFRAVAEVLSFIYQMNNK